MPGANDANDDRRPVTTMSPAETRRWRRQWNTASGVGATIGGGGSNGSAPAVTGGRTDRRSAAGSSTSSSADGGFGTVGGGCRTRSARQPAPISALPRSPAAGYNQVTRAGGTVGGGNSNTTSNFDATVGGGNSNTASGEASIVPGGLGNLAPGLRQSRCGSSRQGDSDGCFAWADATTSTSPAALDNAFTARATGGVYFVPAINGSGTPTAGVQLAGRRQRLESLSDRAVEGRPDAGQLRTKCWHGRRASHLHLAIQDGTVGRIAHRAGGAGLQRGLRPRRQRQADHHRRRRRRRAGGDPGAECEGRGA